MPNEIQPASELAAEVRAQNRGDWRIYENEVFAQVFEFPGHVRMQVWDEADFMGSLDGYSWNEQAWSGREWVDVTPLSTEGDGVPVDKAQILAQLEEFRETAALTNPANLDPREASLDRMSRAALGSHVELSRQISDLERALKDTRETNHKMMRVVTSLSRRVHGDEPTTNTQTGPENTRPVIPQDTPGTNGPSL